jgi:exosortase/archaeosortase family protein
LKTWKNIPVNWVVALKEKSAKGRLFRFIIFILLYLAGRYFEKTLEGTEFLNLLHKPFLWFIDTVTVCFCGLFYEVIGSTNDHVLSIDNKAYIHLAPGCSGLSPLLRMTIILIFYPINWKIKSWLLPVSWIIILVAATIHFIILVPISYYYPENYNFYHNWPTRIIFYGLYFCIWIIWEKSGYRNRNLNKTQDYRT